MAEAFAVRTRDALTSNATPVRLHDGVQLWTMTNKSPIQHPASRLEQSALRPAVDLERPPAGRP